MSAEVARPSAWRPLRDPLFRGFWIALLLSNIGTWMHSTSATWMMTTLSPSTVMVALMQTATTLPFFVLALPAGALADVTDRRMVLLAAVMWSLLVAALLGVLAMLGHVDATSLLLLTFALGIGSAIGAPAQQAIVPELVESNELPQAVALNGIAFNIARAIGPALGGLLIATMGTGVIFLLNAASFAGLLVVVSRWQRTPFRDETPPEQILGAMRAGARYAAHAGPLRAVLVRGGGFVVPATALWALLPIVVRSELGWSAAGYGGLLGCLGVGAVACASVLPQLRGRLGVQNLVAASTVAFALSTAVLAISHSASLLAAAMFLGGMAWIAAMSSLNVAAQSAVPAWVRARGLAIHLLVSQGGMAAGGLVWGVVGSTHGVRASLLVAAATMIVLLALVRRYDLGVVAELDLSRSSNMVIPPSLDEWASDSGPVLVMVEYTIAPERAAEFMAEAQSLRPLRRRDGALDWSLYRDATDPTRFVETFTVASWNEHVRQHYRATVADEASRAKIRAFHTGDEPPKVHHFLTATGRTSPPDERSSIPV